MSSASVYLSRRSCLRLGGYRITPGVCNSNQGQHLLCDSEFISYMEIACLCFSPPLPACCFWHQMLEHLDCRRVTLVVAFHFCCKLMHPSLALHSQKHMSKCKKSLLAYTNRQHKWSVSCRDKGAGGAVCDHDCSLFCCGVWCWGWKRAQIAALTLPIV